MPEMSIVDYLQTLEAVRERCNKVLEMGIAGKLENFKVNLEKLPEAADMICDLISRDYGPIDNGDIERTLNAIPPHGRWRHFGNDNMKLLIDELTRQFSGDKVEVTRSILDLFTVAVLLDAGAGDLWKYNDDGKFILRSEGLAVASLRMFQDGKFSSTGKLQVDSAGLKNLKEADLIKGFQVTGENPLLGVKGRLELLQRLGDVIEKQTIYFPQDSNGLSRPGAMIDYLLKEQCGESAVHIDTFWRLIIKGFGGVWPESRTKIQNVSMGDVWPCTAINDMVPFHKLSQWLAYSLMEPITFFLGVKFVGAEKMTGLAEYRNGGLFIDLGIIALKGQPNSVAVPTFSPDSQVIIEWRALTVALIDHLAQMMRQRLNVNSETLPLPKLLEAGTWKAGREIAKKLRPSGGGPPITILSDGTLF